MKSDLTCPVEVVHVAIQRETEDTNENGQILCLIDFFNLSDKVIDSIQMNIICFDAEEKRIGGRLVRAGAHGEPRENFSGAFAPEHVENVARVEASVEKVWYQDGVIWRREERNVREYTPNALPPGRELDRLRSVAGPDAVGYAREDDKVWLCVCGRANRTSDDSCLRCGRDRAHTVKAYSFAAIDSTLGRKERMLEEQTRETLRRSSEQTVEQMKAVQKKQKKQKKRLRTAILLLALVALLLAAARWGVPYAMSLFAQDKLDRGLAADAKELYALIDRYWPEEFGAKAGMDAAEQKIIDGLMNVGTDAAYEQAALRAAAIGDTAREEKAVIARAELAAANGDTGAAEALLAPLEDNEEAQSALHRLIYDVAKAAKEKLDYPTAIARFDSLGDYEDAAAQKTDSIDLYGRLLMREGKYQAACDQFMQIADTGDAIALIRQCRYALGLEKQQAGDYEEAAALFESLGIYEDAQTRGQICRYTAGTNALSAGELEKAAEQLLAAGDYQDAAQKFADVATTLGNAALEAGDNQTAIGWLEQLPESEETQTALEVTASCKAIAARLEAACDARAGRIEDEGLRVVLCGRPNAGKSSLLNALLGGERAIVTDIPGTTRDTLTEAMQIGGVRVLLTDTAGLRETGDAVERIGVERAKKALAEADVRALVLDGASPLTEEDKAALFGLAPQLIILSKGDLAPVLTADEVRAAFGDVPTVAVCAPRGEGMEALKEALAAFVPEDGAESSALSQARHVEAARRACAALSDAVAALSDGMPLDVAAVDLSAALDALGEITGETMSEKVIDEVFAKFCVGK